MGLAVGGRTRIARGATHASLVLLAAVAAALAVSCFGPRDTEQAEGDDAGSHSGERTGERCLLGSMHIELADLEGDVPGASCLPFPIPRSPQGTVDCTLTLNLLPSGDAPVNAITACSQVPHSRDLGNADGSARCMLDQVPAIDGVLPADAEGWFYDDFSELLRRECGSSARRISVTDGIEVPERAIVLMDCGTTRSVEAGADPAAFVDPAQCELPHRGTDADVGGPCRPAVEPEGGFDGIQGYVEVGAEICATRACVVFGVAGSLDPACDPGLADCFDPLAPGSHPHCSCRCSAPDGLDVDPVELCACPEGFECREVLHSGPAGAVGSYCVREDG